MPATDSKKGGLLGSLLLPGYTDAGANVTFQAPAATAAPHNEHENENENENDHGADSAGLEQSQDLGSEAATEIRDNRTASKDQLKKTWKERQRVNQTATATTASTPSRRRRMSPPSNSLTKTPDDSDLTPSSRVAGFFPSTKPIPASCAMPIASSAATTSTTATESNLNTTSSSTPPAQAVPLTPTPESPPSLFRKQLPVMRASSDAVSVAATSVVPEIGAVQFSQEQLEDLEQENQRRLALLEREPGNTTNTIDYAAGTNLPTLSAANLERASRLGNGTDNDSTTDSSTIGPNREASLLTEDREDGEGESDVGSTASQMGTVIELGNHAARMAEIDAMAAMIEASPNIQAQLTPRPDGLPPAPSQTPQRRSGPPDTVSSLALPVLDPQSTELPTMQQPSPLRSKSTDETKTTEKTGGESIHRMKTSVKASEMLTTAIRRIGSGLHKTKASLSAPPTPKTPGAPAPPALEELLKSTLTPRGSKLSQQSVQPPIDEHRELPASLALRSPGSSARLSLRRNAQLRHGADRPKTFLAPRFSSSGHSNSLSTSLSFDFPSSTMGRDVSFLPNKEKTKMPLFPKNLDQLSPFRMAQKAFSFDSILDGDGAHSVVQSTTDSQVIKLEASFPARRTEYEKTPMATHMGIQESASWDVGGSSAFREEPHRSYRIGGMQKTPSQEDFNHQRARINSDFSPAKIARGDETDNVVELQTPQRVMDVEREDALDILACLVERGIASWTDEVQGEENDQSSLSTPNVENLITSIMDDLDKTNPPTTPPASDEKEEKGDEKDVKKESAKEQHDRQIAALKEVLKSYSYAVEMKRASLSASGWLKSIGRAPGVPTTATMTIASTEDFPELPDPSKKGTETDEAVPTLKLPTAIAQQAAAAAAQVSSSSPTMQPLASSSSASSPVDQKMQLLTLKARLHSAEQELREKTENAHKLNLELSKCRAEIGRLQIATRSELNQNRSMMDEEAEDSTTGSAGPVEANPSQSGAGKSPAAEEEVKLFDESFQGDNSLFQDVSLLEEKNKSHESESLDVLVLKTALEEANQTITKLHKELHPKEGDEGEAIEPPTIRIPDTSLSGDKLDPVRKGSASPGDENRTVNVRMLDGENFLTEWDEVTPLPPPPDHGIDSPIVNAVLEQWTTDRGLHESLLAWIDRVMTGDDLESSVPPLTISSLDHQVRDGFTMHVLPLLLRRADIHVSVQMRAHRRTTYDLAVAVNQKVLSSSKIGTPDSHVQPSSSLLDHHTMYDEWQQKFQPLDSTRSVAHSAVTEAIVNSASRHNPQLRNGEDAVEYSHFGIPHPGSDDAAEEALQPTFMGALGGALGGLLSRNKYTPSQSPSRFFNDASMSPTMRSVDLNPSPTGSASQPRPAEMDDQPYHRVVSAPPGRIGVTFVEYRGHAMVSDVAPDSPLSSWVFPSDILIAVDEVPVSGMRVRDIIKVLTSRKDRQRALRVISSHAMNEFTLNQSTFADDLS